MNNLDKIYFKKVSSFVWIGIADIKELHGAIKERLIPLYRYSM